jgi:hypothetical protein
MKRFVVVFFVLLVFVAAVFAGDDDVVDLEMLMMPCLPESEFVISGIGKDFNKEKVIALKGEPAKVVPYDEMRSEILKYPGLSIGIVNNDHVFELIATSPEHKTPSGIAPGMSKEDVRKILDKLIVYGKRGEDTYSLHSLIKCGDTFSLFYMHLHFKDNILEKIDYGYDLP